MHTHALEADAVEALAFVDLYAAAPAPLRAALGLQTRQDGGATLLLARGVPASMFNRVIGAGLVQPLDRQRLADWQALYRAEGGRPWWLHWHVQGAPVDAPRLLREAGFEPPARRSWAKVWRGAAAAPQIATTLTIVPTTPAWLETTLQAVTQSFGMPPFMAGWLAALHGRPRWRLYSALDGDTPVGGAALFIDGRRAWLGIGGVLPSHRRRGGQGALMARRIGDAIDAGCSDLYTETGEAVADEPNPSLGNMLRCGFEKVASRLNFEAPAGG